MFNLYALTALLVALAALGKWARVYPHRPLFLALLAPALASCGLVVAPWLWPVVLAIDGLVALAALADLLTLPRAKQFTVERQLGLTASLAKTHPVTLMLTNRAARGVTVWVRDGVPEGMTAEPEEFVVQLPPLSRSTLRYGLRAAVRGEFTLGATHLAVRSRRGMWQRMLRLPCVSRVNVYPDMKQLGEYALLARTNRLSLMGLRRTRRVGQDNEFERLRDYTPDDSYKHIHWGATARRRKLTVRDFQANQSQRLVFLIDCGRMMTGEAQGVSLLDHALNAALMLSFVALRQNDQVGMLCFSDRVHSFLPPRGGREQMNRLLHAAYNRFPQMVESRYDEAFLHLSKTVRKRALVVLITNVVDEVNAEAVRTRLTALGGRHLPVAVLLRDHAVFDAVEAVEADLAPVLAGSRADGGPARPFSSRAAAVSGLVDDDRLFRAAAAAEVLNWRRHVVAELEMSGVLLVDAFPEGVTAPLVNRYLEIKARRLL